LYVAYLIAAIVMTLSVPIASLFSQHFVFVAHRAVPPHLQCFLFTLLNSRSLAGIVIMRSDEMEWQSIRILKW